MGSSIRTGLRALLEKYPDIRAALILLVDQPYLTPDLLNAFLEAYQNDSVPVVAARYGNTLGVPALFDRSVFSELLDLDQQVGARKVIAAYRDRLKSIAFPEGAVDLDTPEDWATFTNQA